MSTNNQYNLNWTGSAASITFSEFKTWFDGFMVGLGGRQVTANDLAEIQKMMNRVRPDQVTIPSYPSWPSDYPGYPTYPYPSPFWYGSGSVQPPEGDYTIWSKSIDNTTADVKVDIPSAWAEPKATPDIKFTVGDNVYGKKG